MIEKPSKPKRIAIKPAIVKLTSCSSPVCGKAWVWLTWLFALVSANAFTVPSFALLVLLWRVLATTVTGLVCLSWWRNVKCCVSVVVLPFLALFLLAWSSLVAGVNFSTSVVELSLVAGWVWSVGSVVDSAGVVVSLEPELSEETLFSGTGFTVIVPEFEITVPLKSLE